MFYKSRIKELEERIKWLDWSVVQTNYPLVRCNRCFKQPDSGKSPPHIAPLN